MMQQKLVNLLLVAVVFLVAVEVVSGSSSDQRRSVNVNIAGPPVFQRRNKVKGFAYNSAHTVPGQPMAGAFPGTFPGQYPGYGGPGIGITAPLGNGIIQSFTRGSFY